MKFLRGMFTDRRPTPPAEAPRPEPPSPATVARLAREHADAERDAARRREGAEEIERAVGRVGFWFPRDVYAPEPRRLSARPSLRERIAALFDDWRR